MFAGKEVRVLLKGQAKESYLELKRRDDKESIMLVNSIQRIINILKENPQFGDPIAKGLIPIKFKQGEIQNLYRAELSNYSQPREKHRRYFDTCLTITSPT